MFNISCSQESELMMHEMNQIQSFMSKFKSGMEVIWGIYFDNELGQQLKVTLLATGFDIQNVPQIMNRKSQMTDDELQHMEEIKRKRELRKSKYYPDSMGSQNRYKSYAPFVLAADQMDYEALIDMMEQIPANKRDARFLEKVSA